MKKALVSVIVPTYNRASFLRKALESVFNQTYRPIELIIVDDGSKDHTKRLVNKWIDNREYDGSFKTKYFYQNNKGAPKARNKGLQVSMGRYIQFLDSDDYLHHTKIEKQVNRMREDKTPVSLCSFNYVNREGVLLKKINNDLKLNQIISNFIGVHTSTPIIDTKKIDCKLEWNEKLEYAQDVDFFIRLFTTINGYSYIDEYLFNWVIHDDERIRNLKGNKNNNFQILSSILRFTLTNFLLIHPKKYSALFILYLRLLHRGLNLFSFKKIGVNLNIER